MECFESDKSELVSVYGRRRVGKTFLIKRCFNEEFDFWFTGIYKSGAFISIIQLLITISRYEQLIVSKVLVEETSIIKFILMIFVSCRPLLIGTGMKVIISGIIWILREDKNVVILEKQSDSFSILSRREKEVARLAAKSYTNARIAEELYISTETVKRHMSTIFEKLGIESRKQLKKVIIKI